MHITTIKWDGSPAIVFGRDETGQFILTDKSGFASTTYDGKAKSAEELQSMFTNRKPAMDAERKQFIANMGDIFDEYEKATPVDFRGFLMGDLMYYNTPGLEDHVGYVFQPNVVRYEVPKDSKLGNAIGKSKTGVVVHKYSGDMYSSVKEAVGGLQGNEVLAIPPVYVNAPANIDMAPVKKLEAFAAQHKDCVTELFNPEQLRGIANVHTLFYKYINTKVDSGLENLGDDFDQWLNTEKLSSRKRTNINAYLEKNNTGVMALWTLIKGVMKLKDWLVNEFDSRQNDIQMSVAGERGGEGYVVNHPGGPVKLVSRSKFTAANRELHR